MTYEPRTVTTADKALAKCAIFNAAGNALAVIGQVMISGSTKQDRLGQPLSTNVEGSYTI